MMVYNRRHLYIAITIAVLIRIVVFFYLIIHPIADNPVQLISPLIMRDKGGDMRLYLLAQKMYFSKDSKDVKDIIHDIMTPDPISPYYPISVKGQPVVPLFPALLSISNYKEGSTLPLSAIYFLFSIILSYIWLEWLFNKKVHFLWLIFFAIIPNYLYFTFAIGPDLLFYLLFAVYYLYYFKADQNKRDICIWVLMLFLMILTRPNTLSIMLFIVIDFVFFKESTFFVKAAVSAIMVIGAILLWILLNHYFFAYIRHSMFYSEEGLFGYTTNQYLHGIYNSLPLWLNYICSYISLIFAKIVYLFGLRPSISNQSLKFIILRGYTGLVLLPGFAYLFFQGYYRDKILVSLFILPVIIGVPNEKYILTIYPIIFYYTTVFFGNLYRYYYGIQYNDDKRGVLIESKNMP